MNNASITTIVIHYPNGSVQVVKPNPTFFKGNWHELAFAIGAPYFPSDAHGNIKVNYELK